MLGEFGTERAGVPDAGSASVGSARAGAARVGAAGAGSADERDLRERVLHVLDSRNMLMADGVTTRFGQPAFRAVLPGHEPERLMDATQPQRNLVACSYATPWTSGNACAEWIERAYARQGYGVVQGDAYRLFQDFCSRTDTAQLKVGMIVGVGRHPFGANGLCYGHVGLYVGDGLVRDSADERLRTSPLEAWLSVYGVMEQPRWGWLGGVALDQVRRV